MIPKRRFAAGLAVALWAVSASAPAKAADVPGFRITLSASAAATPITGRIFLIATPKTDKEPRFFAAGNDASLFGIDVRGLKPGGTAVMEPATPGYPARTLGELPAGDYRVQAVLDVYTGFHRSDGRVIWAHMDQWEGQRWAISPGNLVSEPVALRVGTGGGAEATLSLTRAIPPIEVPPDTPWVKHLRIRSALLSGFWGHPIYLGATVLLPRGYDAHPAVRYPAIYLQGHFNLGAPFGFTTEPDKPGTKSWARQREEWTAQHRLNVSEPPRNVTSNGSLPNVESGYEFYQSWSSDGFPRMIAVTFQHPTPYYDDSYGINSANAGPYGDAFMTELIPAVEERFRILRAPYARVLAGSSTGGWGSLALQVYHPDFFGGSWSFSPDPVDFRRYYGATDLYSVENAFNLDDGHYLYPVRNGGPGNRRYSQELSILGAEDGGLEWSNLTPVGDDGYPKPIWNLKTGAIDRSVVAYMRAHDYDLRDYLQRNWSRIGPLLVGKIHVFCGDDDTFYLNLAVYLLEDFLENTHNPYYAGKFTYGRPLKRHGWEPTTNADLVRTMAAFIAHNSPPADAPAAWLLADAPADPQTPPRERPLSSP